MAASPYIGRLDRGRLQLVHNDTVYVQPFFEQMGAETFAGPFTYPPLWASLDPGMTLEPHHHPQAEIYVFTSGEGTMQLGDEMFAVCKDVAVYIAPNELHAASNKASAAEPLTWVSLGLR